MSTACLTHARGVLRRGMPLPLALFALACSAFDERRASPVTFSAAGTTVQSERTEVIDHLLPRRDSVGPTPTRFAWTPIEDTDFYMMAVWNDADVLVYRRDHLRATSVDWPASTTLESGTYFWSVAAFRGDRPVAESGRSAFVVVERP